MNAPERWPGTHIKQLRPTYRSSALQDTSTCVRMHDNSDTNSGFEPGIKGSGSFDLFFDQKRYVGEA